MSWYIRRMWNTFAPGLSSGVKLHVKKYVCHKAAVGNSLMIRDGVGLRAVTGNVRSLAASEQETEREREDVGARTRACA